MKTTKQVKQFFKATMLFGMIISAKTVMASTHLAIENKTDNRDQLEVSCLKKDCSLLSISFNLVPKQISLIKLEEIANTRIIYTKKFGVDEIKLSPYSLSSHAAKRSYNGKSPSVLWKDGHEVSAVFTSIGRGAEVAALGIVDTVILPVSAANYAFSVEKDPNQKAIKLAATTILSQLAFGKSNEISYKERRFDKFRKLYYSLE